MVLIHGQMWNFGSLVEVSCWYELGLMVTSSGRSNLPACMSASCVAASLTPIVTVISLTYWCLTGSVLCFHAGFFTSVIDRLGTKDEILYGPSETMCLL